MLPSVESAPLAQMQLCLIRAYQRLSIAVQVGLKKGGGLAQGHLKWEDD